MKITVIIKSDKTMKQTETETTRVKVDYAHLAELEKMECVEVVNREPRILLHVRSELTPDFPAIARFGDTVEQETRRRLPWVQPERKPREFGRVFAGKRLVMEEGGCDD